MQDRKRFDQRGRNRHNYAAMSWQKLLHLAASKRPFKTAPKPCELHSAHNYRNCYGKTTDNMHMLHCWWCFEYQSQLRKCIRLQTSTSWKKRIALYIGCPVPTGTPNALAMKPQWVRLRHHYSVDWLSKSQRLNSISAASKRPTDWREWYQMVQHITSQAK